MLDNGQHVFLRCCTAYRELLARLGMTGSVSLQDRFDVTVLAPGRPGPAAPDRGCPARCTWARPWPPTGSCRWPSGCGWRRAALAMRSLDPAKPGLDSSGWATGWPPTGRASMPAGCCGTCSPCPR